MKKSSRFRLSGAGSALLLAALTTSGLQAQSLALEEIVVTAQRRTQNLQQVPISLEYIGGEEIMNQGYRDVAMLANYSPGIILEKNQSQGGANAYIRGFGTSGLNLTIVQAAPTFVDQINQSRISQSMLAYMDIDRVEILKGPQPIFFGQNATAGAFNITSKRPTPEWEGYVNAEVGSFGGLTNFKSIGNQKIEAAAGGPITDTIGIRVAGKYESSDGHMIDIVTQGAQGYYQTYGGRIIMDWRPNEDFTALMKVERGYLSQVPEAQHICRTEGPARLTKTGDPSTTSINDPNIEGDELSVWLPYPQGSGYATPHKPLGECFKSRDAMPLDFVAPPWNIRANQDDRGMIDIRQVTSEFTQNFLQTSRKGSVAREDLKPFSTYLNMNYTFANDIEANFVVGYQDFWRNLMRPNRNPPFMQNVHHRQEDLKQWNLELRVTSPTGGRVEWMAGASLQDEALSLFQHSTRASVFEGYWRNFIDQDNKWLSAFGSLTFNFQDNKYAIDLGARYTDAEILTEVDAHGGGLFVFDVAPCQSTANDFKGPEFANLNPATCTIDPLGVRVDPNNLGGATLFLVDSAPGGRAINTSNLWYLPYRATRRTPSTWRSPLNAPVGLYITDTMRSQRDLKTTSPIDSSDSGFDPQIVLRYNMNDDTSFYAKWAESWKVGGVDTGVQNIPSASASTPNVPSNTLLFGSEFAHIFEGGVKGKYWDGRASYEISIYEMVFSDLQTGTENPFDDQGSGVTNAGKQRVRGIDWATTVAVTERLRAGLSGAYMDAVLVDFPTAGCTDFEFAFPEESGCDVTTGTIDRSGQTPARSPKFTAVLNLDYTHPFMDQYEWSFGTRAKYGSSYHSNPNSFSTVVNTPSGGDISLNVGFGDIEGIWDVTFSARNLLERRQKYHPERDLEPEGVLTARISENEVKAFALQYRYNF